MRPAVLIEHWLPIEAIGAESQRERGASSALPPLYFLHVWWARRPLIASRAAVLASLLPQWSADWPPELHAKFPDAETYHQWFLHLAGVRGDPVKGRKTVEWAKAKGIKLDFHPYGGAPRAFTVNPSTEDLQTMGDLLEHTWGTRELSVLDPFAGGGSIPFEALRYGFTTIANDLNPVAAVILKATLDYPARFGPELAEDIRRWGDVWAKRVKPKLQPYFTPLPPGAEGAAYLWARTVACPTTGKPVPLSPNWWLRRGDDPVAVKLIAEQGMEVPRFEIVTGAKVKAAQPDAGTISRGVGRSPWTGEAIDGDYIKAEAQAGRMGQMLYAVAVKVRGCFDFRAPTAEDLAAVKRAEEALAKKKQEWIAKDIIPNEPFPGGNDNRPITYGMPFWADFFSPRQLLAMGTFVETLREVEGEIRAEVENERAEAISVYLAAAMSKSVNRNAYMSIWTPQRLVIGGVFRLHAFAFVWAFAEFDASSNLLPWTTEQITDAYGGLADLVAPAQQSFLAAHFHNPVDRLTLKQGSAASLSDIPDNSIHNITVDPPYYDNVMYAELADFFYVWLKRSVGHIFPEFFRDELTNKDDEAVANPARFAAPGRKKKELADQDYVAKMAAAFREMYRVLHPDGVLTVMFTHKRVEAWDALATALIGAGFSVRASWPVHTESEHSLHQAKKNAAASTILLVCRKRPSPPDPLSQKGEGEGAEVWWDDLKGLVRRTAREKAEEFSRQGIAGVDLYISTFGPVLSVISEHWPVLTSEVDEKTGQPKPLRPETALDLAREEVIALRKRGLLAGREVQFDPVTDWYLMAWDAFKGVEFPADEARKLAIALGIDLEDNLVKSKRVLAKKGQFVTLQPPAARRKKGTVDPDVQSFDTWLDAAHTAMLVLAEDGDRACERFLRAAGLLNDGSFKACLQSLINAIPCTRARDGGYIRLEAELLERLRTAFFDDLTPCVLVEPDLDTLATQLPLMGEAEEGDKKEEGEE